ncbi:cell division cycle 7-related protein kinase [Topomyia yanbarensis]|uniref:cell division cycle 7-related protein kinase n=1 Tax=Topomyia yanbarensis TaxID=2498891 RepID=UPI00273CC9B6|nr:cell division cycle 7-related protein kinase [Topomyia yanbarensis]
MEVINEAQNNGENASTKPAEDRKIAAELAELLTNEVPKKDEKLVANLRQQIPDIDNIFKIHRKTGHGTFSSVFLGSLKCQERLPADRKKLFAIKHVVPTSHPSRIERELRCMMQIGGACNVVGVDLCLRRQESVAFVMPYIPHDQFHQYYDKMSPAETQLYMKNLLIALKRVHEFCVIHRDVKPSNFLYNRKLQKFLLVDFGLAQDISHKRAIRGTETNSAQTAKQVEDKTGKRRLSGETGAEKNQQCSDAVVQQQKKLKLVDDNLENSTKPANEEQMGIAQVQQPPPVFKTPLKQSNQIISPMKLSNVTKDLYSSPLARQIKSTVLGISTNIKVAQRQQQRGTVSNQPAVAPMPPKTATGGARNHQYNTSSTAGPANKQDSVCECFGKSQVCNICLVKKEMQASRAGTPGYRPPEVLLKYPDQTTVVDIWAAGVMFMSILSRCYPFFKNSDDLHSLAEIITVFGDQRIKKTAIQLGRHVKTAQRKQPLDLRKLCLRLRFRFRRIRARQQQDADETATTFANSCDNCQLRLAECLCEHSEANRDFSEDEYSERAYDLLHKLLEINPHNRISAEEALNHPFFQETY